MPNQDFKNLLREYGVMPSKKMGQNFLLDKSILKKIIDSAELSNEDTILEIGPGTGILTIALAQKAKNVIAIEKDENLTRVLINELKAKGAKNVEIIHGDVLKIFNSQFSISNYKVVANLPYYIVSPVIRMFLEAKNKPELMVLMVQKEVAQRICAKPPQMSILAISVRFYATTEIIVAVSKKCFYPQPKVDSTIIKIIPKEKIPEIDTKKFFQLVKTGFAHKRKMLINNLSKKIENQKSQPKADPLRAEKLKTIFNDIGISSKTRAENLTLDDWLKLYEATKYFF